MPDSTTADLAEVLETELLDAVRLERTVGEHVLDELAENWCRRVCAAADVAAYRQVAAECAPAPVVRLPDRSSVVSERCAA